MGWASPVNGFHHIANFLIIPPWKHQSEPGHLARMYQTHYMDHNNDTRSDQGHDRDNKTYVSALSTIRYMLKRWLRQLSLHQWCASHATTSQDGTCRGFLENTPIRVLSFIEPPTDHCQDDKWTDRIFLPNARNHLSEIKLPRNWITDARHNTQPVGDKTSGTYETWFSS